jgi:hypothetical protein
VAGGERSSTRTAARDLPGAPPAPKRAPKHPYKPQSSGRTREGYINLYHNRSKLSSFFPCDFMNALRTRRRGSKASCRRSQPPRRALANCTASALPTRPAPPLAGRRRSRRPRAPPAPAPPPPPPPPTAAPRTEPRALLHRLRGLRQVTRRRRSRDAHGGAAPGASAWGGGERLGRIRKSRGGGGAALARLESAREKASIKGRGGQKAGVGGRARGRVAPEEREFGAARRLQRGVGAVRKFWSWGSVGRGVGSWRGMGRPRDGWSAGRRRSDVGSG